MGLRQPKSLVEVREGRSFLDIIIGQATSLRRRYGIRLPLLLMNSEVTREQTLQALRGPHRDVAEDFLQSIEPKLDAETLEPVSWAARALARVVPARPRRRLRLAASLGHAGEAARAGDRVRHDLEL